MGCEWAFSVKVNPHGCIARLKVRLVDKGYAQTYEVDYLDTLIYRVFTVVSILFSLKFSVSKNLFVLIFI